MERLIKSGKYERWVESDPKHFPPVREAWDMLLTDRFTLNQICERISQSRIHALKWRSVGVEHS